METCIEEELTSEEEIALGRMQFISNQTADHYKIERKFLTIKERKSFAGRCEKDEIIIARSVLRENEAWQTYIAVHEICHDIAGTKNGHNRIFMQFEEQALRLRGIMKVYRPKKHIQWVKYAGEWWSWNETMRQKRIIER